MDFVTWENRYNINIPEIDEQHRHLISIINRLYDACTVGDKHQLETGFKVAVKETVDYVKKHFSDEEKMMLAKGYPDYPAHKAKHDEFVRKIIEAVSNYTEGKPLAANNFIRFLTGWLLEHIAITDKEFARFALNKGV